MLSKRILKRGLAFSIRSAKPAGVLSSEEVERFHKDGYLLAKNLFTKEEKKNLITWTKEIQDLKETAGKWMQYFEKDAHGKKLLCRTENFLEYHPNLDNIIQGKLLTAVADLLGEDAIVYKEKINFKLPGGKGFTAHQDAPAFTTFGQKFHITAMMGVDPATVENGCLWVSKGFHKYGMLETNDDGTIKKFVDDNLDWQPVESDSGDALFFGSYLPHKSFENKSKNSRRAFYLTYNASREGSRRMEYYKDKREQFPPDIERDPKKDYTKGSKQ